jgi:hypothetical protein
VGHPADAAVSAPPTQLTSTALVRVDELPTSCDYDAHVVDYTTFVPGDGIALDGHLVIDLWSDEPNDLAGVVFVVEQHAVVPDMTVERWHAYQDAKLAWRKRYDAFLNGEVASGRSSWIDSSVTMPPPPPPRTETAPPRPSRNARWVAGYWQWAEGAFHWIVGMWEVPDSDIAQDLTVHAPTPPPAARAEPPDGPAPATTAVWTPGQWQWDGRAYVWIAGSWRIPPSGDHTWKPAGWAIKAGGAVFVPGGWQVHVRLR